MLEEDDRENDPSLMDKLHASRFQLKYNWEHIFKKYENIQESGVEVDIKNFEVYAPEEMDEKLVDKLVQKSEAFGAQFGMTALAAPCNLDGLEDCNKKIQDKCQKMDKEFRKISKIVVPHNKKLWARPQILPKRRVFIRETTHRHELKIMGVPHSQFRKLMMQQRIPQTVFNGHSPRGSLPNVGLTDGFVKKSPSIVVDSLTDGFVGNSSPIVGDGLTDGFVRNSSPIAVDSLTDGFVRNRSLLSITDGTSDPLPVSVCEETPVFMKDDSDVGVRSGIFPPCKPSTSRCIEHQETSVNESSLLDATRSSIDSELERSNDLKTPLREEGNKSYSLKRKSGDSTVHVRTKKSCRSSIGSISDSEEDGEENVQLSPLTNSLSWSDEKACKSLLDAFISYNASVLFGIPIGFIDGNTSLINNWICSAISSIEQSEMSGDYVSRETRRHEAKARRRNNMLKDGSWV